MTTDKPIGVLLEYQLDEQVKSSASIITVDGEKYFNLPDWYKEVANGKLLSFTPNEMCRIAPTFSKTFLQPTENQLEWIRNNLDPEDVFTAKQLDQWANHADYVPRPSH